MTIVDQIGALERVKRSQEESLEGMRSLRIDLPGIDTAIYRIGRNIEAIELAIARLKKEMGI